jgi:hypothetical protein
MALIPDENIVASEFRGRFGDKSVDTLPRNPVDVVIVNGPRIVFVQWVPNPSSRF